MQAVHVGADRPGREVAREVAEIVDRSRRHAVGRETRRGVRRRSDEMTDECIEVRGEVYIFLVLRRLPRAPPAMAPVIAAGKG